jgi:hypothetical protein
MADNRGTWSPTFDFMLPLAIREALTSESGSEQAPEIRGTASPELQISADKLAKSLSFSHFTELIPMDDPRAREEARAIGWLPADLREELPDIRGFAPRNLKCMRAFAAAWPGWELVQEALAQIHWYHHTKIVTPEAAISVDLGGFGHGA